VTERIKEKAQGDGDGRACAPLGCGLGGHL
jgi:hypothetical protein